MLIILCLCVSGAPPGSRPALQVHHPRVTGPHQGGVPVSPGTVSQVDNTNAHIHREGLLCLYGLRCCQFPHCLLPSNTKPHPNHSHPPYHNEQNPSSGLLLTHKPGLGSHTHAADPSITVSAYTAVGLSLGDGWEPEVAVWAQGFINHSLFSPVGVCWEKTAWVFVQLHFSLYVCTSTYLCCREGLAATGESYRPTNRPFLFLILSLIQREGLNQTSCLQHWLS